ncbi:hypothetical protein [Streptomyces sp. NPDC058964]|uniref:hypothetical protein n=1 Tax=Streptomyces sp. NPDC058964 TaxID=3346681 RepID=UPI0036BC837C
MVGILGLPSLGTVANAWQRGAECIWGGERLAAETSVDLGEHPLPHGTTAYPRACRRCAPD